MSDLVGFPTKSKAYLNGMDVLYGQFNDIDFYVEDEFQENLYFEILSKLFSNIKFEKIFPLGGKDNVIEYADYHTDDKKKVFIVDNDFDDILGFRESYPNLFYLDRYSIENYFLEEDAIVQYVIATKPNIRRSNVINKGIVHSLLSRNSNLLVDITCYYIIIQQYSLGIDYKKFSKEFYENTIPTTFEQNAFKTYKALIENEMVNNSITDSLEDCVTTLKKHHFSSGILESIIKHCPGKNLLCLLKSSIEHQFKLNQRDIDQFCYGLASKCQFTSLSFLKQAITDYIS